MSFIESVQCSWHFINNQTICLVRGVFICLSTVQCARIDTLKLTNHKERARPNILNFSRYTAESQELRSNKMIEILWKLKTAQREVWRHFCFNLLLICIMHPWKGGYIKSLGKVWGIQKWSFAGSWSPDQLPKIEY